MSDDLQEVASPLGPPQYMDGQGGFIRILCGEHAPHWLTPEELAARRLPPPDEPTIVEPPP